LKNPQVEGDPSGFAEEYPLEALEVSTADYMAKVKIKNKNIFVCLFVCLFV
jgi:hypothetical protein